MNFRKSWILSFLARKFKKIRVFRKFVLESKSWVLIPKEFDFSNIFIGFKWGYFLIYIYVLKLMESKVKGNIYK